MHRHRGQDQPCPPPRDARPSRGPFPRPCPCLRGHHPHPRTRPLSRRTRRPHDARPLPRVLRLRSKHELPRWRARLPAACRVLRRVRGRTPLQAGGPQGPHGKHPAGLRLSQHDRRQPAGQRLGHPSRWPRPPDERPRRRQALALRRGHRRRP